MAGHEYDETSSEEELNESEREREKQQEIMENLGILGLEGSDTKVKVQSRNAGSRTRSHASTPNSRGSRSIGNSPNEQKLRSAANHGTNSPLREPSISASENEGMEVSDAPRPGSNNMDGVNS